jgi:PAS domain S-box-containing protein
VSVFDEQSGNRPASIRGTPFEEHSVEPKQLLEERFRVLVEGVNDYAILMLDPQGVVTTWNVGGERIYGYKSQEIIGQHFSLFYPEQDVAARKCEMELEASAKEGRFEDEGWRVRKDGKRFWANATFTSLWQPDGKLVGFAKVTRDLTERRAAEEERLRLGQAARERIHLLSELAEALAGAQSVGQVCAIVVDLGVRLAKADTCTLYVLDEDRHTLDLVAERGCNPEILSWIRQITRDSGNPTYAIGTGAAEAVWIENERQYAAFLPRIANMRVAGTRAKAFWCVPLVAENRTIGMLGVGFHESHDFSPEEREFVSTFSRQCAQALARARLLQAERAAAALAEQLRASLDTTVRSIGDALIATNAKGEVTLMNQVAEAITGWSEAEARGRPLPEVFNIINEHTRAVAPNPVEKVLESGTIVGLANHTVLIGRDGRETPIDDSGAPIRAREGAIEGVVLVFRDVSERKREESRRAFLVSATTILAESLEYERTVARVAELVVPRLADWCAVDLVVEKNRLPKRLAVAHVNPEKVNLAKELHAKYPPQMDSPTGVPNVIRTGRSELYREIPDELLVAGCIDDEHLRIARELRLHSAMVVPLSTGSGILGALTFVYAESGRVYDEEDLRFAEDLAHRCASAIENARIYSSEQEARRRADLANRAKDEFLAIVSHELRTPLNAIMGWAKLLSMGYMDERRQKSALETIERNSVAMAQLIEDLLDMSRVISGKLRIEAQQVDLVRVLDAATESVRPAALAKGIELAALVDSNVPPILGDATRLQQIVWNLLSNAVKFTSKGGRVELVLRRSGSGLEIVVTDTGKGIAPDFLPRVFEPFRQEDVSPSRARGGLGLGLAITRQLVELHGGQITVHSEGEGHGATFTVTLPISVVTPKPDALERMVRQFEPSTDGFQRPEHIRGLRVLVVDDDDDARRLVSVILEQCGCQVVTAQCVDEAMQTLESTHPDIMLSDIGMPGQNGYDLIRKVRDLPRERGGDIPAAAITAYARAEDRQRLLHAGYSIHLPKPVEPAELVAVVSTLCRFVQRPTASPEAQPPR